jgi:hypothetical protein
VGKILSREHKRNNAWYAEYVADYIDILTDKMKIKKLGEFGLTNNNLEKIALITDHKSNPLKFSTQQLVEFLKARL